MKFKIGDKVRLTEVVGGLPEIGDILEIVDLNEPLGLYYVQLVEKDCDATWFVEDCDIELVDQIDPVPFKIGDKVKLIKFVGGKPRVGDILTVKYVYKNIKEVALTLDKDDSDKIWFAGFCDVELIDKPESKSDLKIDFRVGFDIEKTPLVDYIMIEDYTIAVPHGVPMGISKRHGDDVYNKEIGQALAMSRLVRDIEEKELI